ncbi:MAG TPA: hydroxyisourate hydrolase [Burkholderiales bacterium]|jgi:5-hydroxyisourate hydrolase|nr:hydroxyisourate hydrolase [Burkholderiales bacterium]
MNREPRTGAGLRIEVLDALRGAVAEGLRVEIFRLGQDAEKRCSSRLGTDGALVDAALDVGEYEIVFHLGEYYRAVDRGSRQPLLESVTLRLGIGDPQCSYDLPLRISPSGICMPGV